MRGEKQASERGGSGTERTRRVLDSERRCKNIYRFLRLCVGDALSDREIARRLGMNWTSFADLKHGARQVPRIQELEAMAELIELDASVVFDAARGIPAEALYAQNQASSRVAAGERVDARAVRKALELLPDLLFRIREDGTYLEFIPSPAIEPYVEPAAFLGRTIADVLPGNVAEVCHRYVRLALETGRTQEFSYSLPMPEGLRQYEARIVATAPDEVWAVVRDISDPGGTDAAQ